MEWIQAVGLAIVAVLICTLLRKTKPELSFLLSLGACILLVGGVLSKMRPVMNTVTGFLNQTTTGNQYTSSLWKALGICLVTSFAADACRDAGEQAIAHKVELVGQFAILLLSLPLLEDLASLALGLFDGGTSL